MTIEVSNVSRLRLYEEPNGSFCTDHSGTMGDFLDVPFIEGTLTYDLAQGMESPGHAQQHIDGQPEDVATIKSWTLGFEIGLETFTTRATNAVAAAQGALGRLLKIAMGQETLGTGTTVNDGSPSTTEFTVTSAAGLTKGCAIALPTGTGGALEIREIKNISTNDITLKHATTNTIANGATVYACATYTLSNGNSAAGTTAQFALEGLEQDCRWLLRGGQVASMTIATANGQIPRFVFSWTGPQWDYADGNNTAGTLTGTALSTATYANNQPLVLAASELRVGTNGTTSLSGTLIEAPAFEFTPALSYVQHRAPSGTQTVMRWIRRRQDKTPVLTGSFTDPYQAQTWFTARDNRSNHSVWLQIGSSSSTGGACLSAPTVQIVNVQLVDVDGIQCEKMDWKARLDEDITSATTDIHKSAFKVHLF